MRGDGRLVKYPGSRYWHMAYFLNGKEVRARYFGRSAGRAAARPYVVRSTFVITH